MDTRRSTRKRFCVIRFHEENLSGVEAVCIPYSWIISHHMEEGLIKVSYPIEECWAITKERVKQKENFKTEWPCHLAKIIYRTDKYSDAERWLAARTDGGDSKSENSQESGTESKEEPSIDGSFKVVLDQKTLTRFIKLSAKALRSNCHHNDVPVLPIFDDERNMIGYCTHINSSCRERNHKIVIKNLDIKYKSHQETFDREEEQESEEEDEEESGEEVEEEKEIEERSRKLIQIVGVTSSSE